MLYRYWTVRNVKNYHPDMPTETVSATGARAELLELLALPGARPKEALAQARAVLAADPNLLDASVAHQVVGIVLRDFGDVNAAVRELRIADRLARAAHSHERQADVRATMGLTLVVAGRTRAGLADLDAAVAMTTGVARGRVLSRRGITLSVIGRHHDALADLRGAVVILRRSGDQMWEARTLTWLGLTNLALGRIERADANFSAAEGLWAATHQDLELAYATHNRGLVAGHSGNLPLALMYFDRAARRYDVLGTPIPDLSLDRCVVLLAAGLAQDAVDMADAAIDHLSRIRGQATKRAELLLTAAHAALAAADPQTALQRAHAARRLFAAQHRTWWHARAELVLLRARYASAQPASGRLLTDADRLALRLEAAGSQEAPLARLLAGRLAIDLGRADVAERHLTAAAQSRRHGPAMSRVSGWLSEALRAEAAGNPRRMLAACRRGLAVLDEHRFSLGASELRAMATAHGAELAGLAQAHGVRARRPRLLLAWTERWRATTLSVPVVRPTADPELNASLAALRAVTRRLEHSREQGLPSVGLQREQLRLEGVVRARSLQARGTAASTRAIEIGQLLDRLGDATLIEIADIDGILHVLTCGAGRVRQTAAGRTHDAVRAAGFASLALRRLARDRPGDNADSAAAILKAMGPRLQDTILGAAAGLSRAEPIVVVPPSRLHAIPWALLPALADRVFSVAPSAGAWLRARATPAPARQQVTFVRGPGLTSGGAEVTFAAELHDDVTLLEGENATAGGVMAALDGAWLAHIAAHGTFRADSPLFSSLRMHDGPLTVYDFEQLRRAPHRLVLSSCDSGLLAPTGADELLGLVSSLLPLGTAGIIGGVVPLNDQAAVPVMVALHRYLRAGQSFAEALRNVRREADGEPAQETAALSLLPLGAA
jgi:tetratricopeptide (TPR) repeat protein